LKQRLERRFDGVTSVDRDVSMEDFLKHLGIGNEAISART
jgi:hypothetical protein